VSKRSIRDLNLAGRRVLLRVDFNVPIVDGIVTDDTRIRASLPTIRYALEQGATVILVCHLGRPKGIHRNDLSLRPIAAHLSTLLGQQVHFAADCIGSAARDAVAAVYPGGVALLENLRFHPEEELNDPKFSAALAEVADVYINDAFGAAHRAHASTTGVLSHISDAGAGFLMTDELENLETLLASPERPFVAVIGGSKVSGKLAVIENLIDRVDTLLIGGAMSYTFFEAQGLPIGQSLIEPSLVATTNHITRKAKKLGVEFKLPTDHVVTDRIEVGALNEILEVSDPKIANRLGIDIGPKTIATYTSLIESARTVIWNGPMGVFEIDEFSNGTIAIARAVATATGKTVIGGGDSIAAAAKAKVINQITHVSTGGGATLEFLGGRTLPGIEALPDRVT
jgi:phosphoglycerate kinase